ncbi:hypothetical protein CYMTET_42739 [Cymbomonas tetramitiformis]|uniref:Exonuclease domain-containing protein n=1 Tax=Cymbomonas tetramitiformis TaxID=36881 RepID=A0AAE0C5A1_9CHLO|nr:hypothetical protein CYMTET_42739 [Cymbomonas tetramitiformis]
MKPVLKREKTVLAAAWLTLQLLIESVCCWIYCLLRDEIGLSKRVTVNISSGDRQVSSFKNDLVYVHGCVAEGRACIGLWYQPRHTLNVIANIPGPLNDGRAELAAVYVALLRHPRNQPLTVYTSSAYILNSVKSLINPQREAERQAQRNASQTQTQGLCDGTRRLLRALRWILRMRAAKTHFRRAQAHVGWPSTEMSSRLAGVACSESYRVPGREEGLVESVHVPQDDRPHWLLNLRQWYNFASNLEESSEDWIRRVLTKAPSPLRDLVALDCEMVGVGKKGVESVLARVGVVNDKRETLLDTFVAVSVPITDYRTHVSGVRAEDLVGAPSFELVREQVASLLEGKLLVGHAVYNDLAVLNLSHPRVDIRDTGAYKPLMAGSRPQKLSHLAEQVSHCSITAAFRLQ